MRQWKGLALAFAGLASAAAVSRRQELLAQYPDYNLLADCPGYSASNIKKSSNSLTADLKLAARGCNAYGEDLKDLTLEVTYESGKWICSSTSPTENHNANSSGLC